MIPYHILAGHLYYTAWGIEFEVAIFPRSWEGYTYHNHRQKKKERI